MQEFIQSIKDSVFINLIYEDRYQFLLDGFAMTIYLTAMSFILGTLIGALFCKLRLSKNTRVVKAMEWLKTLLVRLPTLVLLILFVYVIFSDLNISIVTLAIFTFSIKAGAYISDIMYSAITSVNQGEVEAARTLGMSEFTAFRLVVLPQAVKQALPVYRNQLIITMQETSLAGFLAIADLTRASNIITSRTMDPYISIIVISVAYLIIGGISGLLFNAADKERHLKSADFMNRGGAPK